ncbi:GNAT family N-acetyltransferase [Mucilaginibacter agri]|uniref:GNAT family N-acetyltransferase n=1 Tax=Mucilaginibacter agri TaxID=2695265 RepID=A0A965ZIV9_9SPHI|nr:GNAT family N-acetyltransferase [Mucilaginibacter agri]NCD70784.1 GNAT family N-acetyltransferase [Mucilaginibacter agri]
MIYREAQIVDIPQISEVRLSVKENVLSNPALITYDDYVEFLTIRGKGWVCEVYKRIVGFSVTDLKDHNVWALFVLPDYAEKGIGKQLHCLMLDWYFSQTTMPIWLGTGFNTKAETFYRKQGWVEIGTHGTKEIKFEMSYENWVR